MLTSLAPFRSPHAEDNHFAPRPGFQAFHDSDLDQSIVDRLAAIARQRNSATALVDGDVRLSYRELVDRALAVAQALAARLDGRPGIVAVQASAPRAQVEGLLGVLFAGRPYLCLPPLDAGRVIDDILVSADPAAILSDDRSVSGVTTAAVPRLRLDDLREAGRRTSPAAASPGDVACLFATSGTTGAPKLVGLSHRAVVFDIGRQINDLFLGPDDRIDLLFHPSFSASLSSVFSALLSGAELHLGPPPGQVASLARWLGASRITISTMTVSTLRTLCAVPARTGALADLRLLSVGGEALLDKDVRAFDAAFPSTCVLQNAMASTEARTYAQYFVPRATPPESPLPIGWPVHGKTVVVADAQGRPLPDGEDGEILVTSRFLASGYVNDPALTAARFVPQPDGSVLLRTGDRGRVRHDGCLVFLGRSDALLKVRGYRVEAGAVERALLDDGRVRQAAVVRRTTASGEDSLAAFVVPDDQRVSERELREPLSDRLPAYAVPSAIHVVPELPVNRNGKVDYQRLAEMAMATSTIAPARRSEEERLAALCASWAYALDRASADPHDDFFASGGDSLRALRLQVQVHARLGVELPLSTLVHHPTPLAVAAWMERGGDLAGSDSVLVSLHAGGAGIPLFCVPGIGGEPLGFSRMAERVGRDRPVHGFRATLTSEPLGRTLRIEEIASDYVGAIDAVIGPETPVYLCGHSFGGIVALEMAHQLHAAGRRLGLMAIIDTPLGAGRPGVVGKARDIAANLPGWLWYDALRTRPAALAARAIGKSAQAWRRLGARATASADTAYPDLRAYFGTRHVPEEVAIRVRARIDAVRRYVRRPLPGPVVLFRSRAQALTGRSDRALGWDRLAAGIEVYDVPGHHESCTRPPHVHQLAATLAARLLAADGE